MRVSWSDMKRQLRFLYDLISVAVFTWASVYSLRWAAGTKSHWETVLLTVAEVMFIGFYSFNAYRRWAKPRWAV